MAEELLPLLEEARDLLLERRHGNSARSPGHNARLAIEAAIALFDKPSSQPLMGDREEIARIEKLRDRLAYQGSLAKHCTGNGAVEALERSLCEESAKDADALSAILASLPAQGGKSDDEALLQTADELAERWAEKPAIRRMAQACASVFSKWASDDIISRFHEQMIALMKQSFVEGALHCRAHPVPGQDGWRAPRAAFVMEAKDGTGWRVQAGYERKEDAHLVADILSGCKPEQEAV